MTNTQLATRVRHPATTALVAVNVLVALVASVMITVADGFDPGLIFLDGVSPLHEWGEMSGEAVDGGEYWRLVTTLFLHYGLLHLLANMIMLWVAARVLEPAVGTTDFLIVYALSGLAASVAVYYTAHDVLTAGASGAVFGLFSALLVVSVRRKLPLWLPLVLLAFGVVTTFALPGMSVAAHAGGLVAGAVAATAIVYGGRSRTPILVAVAALLILLVVLARFV
ncbi:rhomboid family intramembrane serine protease [Herbidospora mongoliensis]|uniref:rhomboid family intramembrane serine protease n=1 Tax=Herbidospora mongoliensis TaxID=688067 RepID=UPI00082981F4|nr:rhomboid family intramembrane serine protease [Herbidospora mongoliensis]